MTNPNENDNRDQRKNLEGKPVSREGVILGTARSTSDFYKIWYENVSPWGTLATVYREAAEVICSHCSDADTQEDFEGLIFPALFLYRHFLELSLKDLLDFAIKGRESPALEVPAKHSLVSLYDDLFCRLSNNVKGAKIVGSAREREVSKSLDLLKSWSVKFEEIDPGSMRFRYPTDKSGKRHPYPLLHDLMSLSSASELSGVMKSVAAAIHDIGFTMEAEFEYLQSQ